MKNFRFLYNNLFDAATVTASSEATNFPVSNIAHLHHTRHWRSTVVTQSWVKWDLGANVPITDVIFKYHNFTSGATVALQATTHETGDVWTYPDLTVTLTPVTAGLLAYSWSANQTYRRWRLIWTNAGTPETYFRIGRAFGGTRYSMVRNFNNIYERILLDPSRLQDSLGGQMFANVESRVRSYKFTFEHLSAAEMAQLQTIFEDYVGGYKPYFICIDADNLAATTMYVRNTEPWTIPHLFMDADYNISISVRWAR